ncbi:hypothetical protein HDU93_007376 [Gonapodya sp. JEL0774]|nr:hypothetical protein HDU93_007376 [Gonapodya sp. JEL0774]
MGAKRISVRVEGDDAFQFIERPSTFDNLIAICVETFPGRIVPGAFRVVVVDSQTQWVTDVNPRSIRFLSSIDPTVSNAEGAGYTANRATEAINHANTSEGEDGGGPIRTPKTHASRMNPIVPSPVDIANLVHPKTNGSQGGDFYRMLRAFLRGVPAWDFTIEDETDFRIHQVQEIIRGYKKLKMDFQGARIGDEKLGKISGISQFWASDARINAVMKLCAKHGAGDIKNKLNAFHIIHALIVKSAVKSPALVQTLGEAAAFVHITSDRKAFWRRMRGIRDDGTRKSVMECRPGELQAAWDADTDSIEDVNSESGSFIEDNSSMVAPRRPSVGMSVSNYKVETSKTEKPDFLIYLRYFLRGLPKFDYTIDDETSFRIHQIEEILTIYESLEMNFEGAELGVERLGCLNGVQGLWEFEDRAAAAIALLRKRGAIDIKHKIENIRYVAQLVDRVLEESQQLVAEVGRAQAFVDLAVDRVTFWRRIGGPPAAGAKRLSFAYCRDGELEEAWEADRESQEDDESEDSDDDMGDGPENLRQIKEEPSLEGLEMVKKEN